MRSLAARLSCALMLALSLPAWADIGPDRAAAVARQQVDGRVLSVERVQSGNRVMYRVKILTARGEVRVVMVDGG
jgi:uncharacterized membrane protein YkoI